ncbi:hypothetical protein [Nocardioides ferulae]|uniref:hypothetical protein n=1 Tax=Nocardioides ferulae TaxID=2340821 RepID=UPI000EAFF53E|nr:hypothetical protein [Nocardioides ferulae]
MTPSLENIVGLAGTLLALGCTLPQLLKLRATATASGVSVAALANSTLSGVAWTLFGIHVGQVWVALPALLTLPGTVGALVLAWRGGGDRSRLYLPAAWGLTLTGAAAVSPLAGQAPLTVVLGCSIALLVGPAALTAWRSHDVSAIAASAWVLTVVDAAFVGAYGVLADVDANLLYAAVATAGSLAILARLATPAELHARLLPAPSPVSRGELELVS